MTIVACSTRAHMVDSPRLMVVYHGMDHQDAVHLMALPSSALHPSRHTLQCPGHGTRSSPDTDEHAVGDFSSHLQHFWTSRSEINGQARTRGRQGDFQTAQLGHLP